MTRYHDQYIADPQHTSHAKSDHGRVHDPEVAMGSASTSIAAISARSSTEGTVQPAALSHSALIMLPETPYFHLDLTTAVRAAERGLSRVPSSVATGKNQNDDNAPVNASLVSR